MQRTLSSFFLFVLLAFGNAPLSSAASDSTLLRFLRQHGDQVLTRAETLAWSVTYFYGGSASANTTPRYDNRVLEIAKKTGALSIWGSNAQKTMGSNVASRCKGLEVLFTLAGVQPRDDDNTSYRDVQPGKQSKLVAYAVEHDMIDPLGGSFFGCHRSLHADELMRILKRIGAQITLPIRHPCDAAERNGIECLRTKTVRIRRGSSQATTPKSDSAKITVDQNQFPFPEAQMLHGIWQLLKQKYLYIENVDEKELSYKLAETLLKEMDDPYTVFMRPRTAKAFQEYLQGELTGIGAQVEAHSQGGVMVVSPLPGSPAMQSGIKPGDHIIKVDDTDITKMNLQEAVDLIRGPVGSDVKLTIRREGGQISIVVTRARITLSEIDKSMYENIAYIKISQFGQQTHKKIGEVLRQAVETSPDGIILDLRNNPGGYLNTAVEVLGHFLPKGSVVAQIKSKTSTKTNITQYSVQAVPISLPVVILVNKGSASASEIVAGAMQDYDRATVVGMQTFGKGSVQEIFDANGQWSVKYTIAEWLTPNGRSIQGNGITPDVEIADMSDGGRDEQFLKAVQIIRSKSR